MKAAATILFAAAFSFSAHAAPVRDAHTEVELVSSSASASPGAEIRVAVHLRPDPRWHVYWKNPGDSGLPPTIDWRLPEGATMGPVEWPYPRKLIVSNIVNYAFEEDILLVVPVRVPASAKPGATLEIGASVSWLACEVECVPGKAELSLALPVKEGTPEPDLRWTPVFAAARSKLPIAGAPWRVRAAYDASRYRLTFTPEAGVPAELSEAYFFPDDNELVDHAEPQSFARAGDSWTLDMPRSSVTDRIPSKLEGVLFSETGWRGPGSEKALAVSVPLEKTTSAAAPPAPVSPLGLWSALLFAFVGGLILNLMPCVLPVLSLKIFAFMKEASENPRALFAHGLAFTAGVVTTFWTLAGVLLAIKAAGQKVGWGFQLQSPQFVIVLAFVFFLFTLNLFGTFEIGTSLTGAGGSLTRRRGLGGAFASGAFATVVATPCTAPFMGTALGFTLSQPPVASFAVFTALALGMAAPYLLLCSQPALLKYVPKPGAWMETLKQALGFPLAATVIWLAWVLGLQRGLDASIALAAGLLVSTVGAWAYGRWGTPIAPAARRRFVTAVFILSIAGGVAIAWKLLPSEAPAATGAGASAHGISWEPYSDERLEALLTEGRPVFLDFTAAWCLTCKVNERVALEVPAVQKKFKDYGVAALKGDWTNQDEGIARALARYGRNSVPLYVLYVPGEAEPRVLPEILTPSIVLEALDALKKK